MHAHGWLRTTGYAVRKQAHAAANGLVVVNVAVHTYA